MAIQRSNYSERGSLSSPRNLPIVSTLPTVKAMRDCFERYLNLTIADGNASLDPLKTYRSRTSGFFSWCRER
ncbi:Integrase family protein (fragment) [Hyella patelloides LEGE 07179]|uniref:Integrase family protein n=1 Tax=Hyella patelloides LEGE 07179 TaxID=945734 RepID=A0A563W4Y5_9CYAN